MQVAQRRGVGRDDMGAERFRRGDPDGAAHRRVIGAQFGLGRQHLRLDPLRSR